MPIDSDRRSGADRRKRVWFNIRILVGDGNRRSFRRKEDRDRIFLVDQYSPVLFMTIVAILFLCAIDALLTLFLLNHGAYETNPIMAYLLNIGPYFFFIPKYGITLIATAGLFLFRGVVLRRLNVNTHSLLFLIAWFYAAVVTWELYLVYRFI
ncbi:MAG: hypothetical protein JSW26_21660 [Desulfobacterales bacterium]|nr:MAG: hypothetical protein JSW26_21660 [Desulfobacterales bacterium]